MSSQIRNNGLFILNDTSATFLPGQPTTHRKSQGKLSNQNSGDLQRRPVGETQRTFTPQVDYQNSLLKLTQNDKMLIFDLQKRISEQRKELDHRNTTIHAIEQNFDALTTLCRNQSSQNQRLKSQNQRLQNQYDSQINNMEMLRKRNQELEHAEELADKEKKRAAKLQEHNDFLTLQNETFEKQLKRRMNDNNDLEFNLRDQKAEHTQASKNLDMTTKAFQALQRDFKEAQNKIIVLKQELQEIRDRHQELTVQHTDLTEKSDIMSSELTVLRKDYQKKDNELESTQEQLQSVQDELDKLHMELGDFKTTQDNQNSLIQQKLSGQQELKSKLYNLNKQMKQKDRAYKQTDSQQKAQIQKLAKQTQDLTKDYDQIKETHAEFMRNKENAYIDLKENIKKLQNKVVELEDDREQFKEDLVQQTQQYREVVSKTRREHGQKVNSFEKMIQERDNQIQELKALVKVKSTSLEYTMQKAKNLQEKLGQQSGQASSSATNNQISIKNSAINSMMEEAKINNIQDLVLMLKKQVDKLKEENVNLSSFNKTKSDLPNMGSPTQSPAAWKTDLEFDDDLDKCKILLAEEYTDIKQIKKQKQLCERKRGKMADIIDNLNKELQKKEGESKRAEKKLEEIEKQLVQLKDQEEQLRKFKNIVEQEESELQMMNRRHKTCLLHKNDLQKRIDSLWEEILKSEGQIQELKENFQRSETQKEELKEQVVEKEEEITKLTTSIQNLKEDIEDVKNTCSISEDFQLS